MYLAKLQEFSGPPPPSHRDMKFLSSNNCIRGKKEVLQKNVEGEDDDPRKSQAKNPSTRPETVYPPFNGTIVVKAANLKCYGWQSPY